MIQFKSNSKLVKCKPIIANRNKMCPFDFYELYDSEIVKARHNGRTASIMVRVCPFCDRQYTSIKDIDDLKAFRIKGKRYYNLNLPEYRAREMVKLNDKGEIVVKGNTIEDKILEALEEAQPLYPLHIARRIGVDKETVKDYLYNKLGNKVFKDEEHYWWLWDGSLRWTHDKVYYLTDYIKAYYWQYRDEEEIEDSKLILDVKKGQRAAINLVADKLQEGVNELVHKYVKTPYLIIAPVPTSKCNSNPPMYEVAELLREHCPFQGEIFITYMLFRAYDMPTSHLERRSTYEEQKASICCMYPHLCNEEFSCIILDDITTTGTMMDVCRDILIENGMPEENIIRLAFAKTGR